jgi:hypothetical protein
LPLLAAPLYRFSDDQAGIDRLQADPRWNEVRRLDFQEFLEALRASESR